MTSMPVSLVWLLFAVWLALLTGCGSTATVVKENLDYRPAVANALSKAIALPLSGERKKILRRQQRLIRLYHRMKTRQGCEGSFVNTRTINVKP